MVYVWPFSRQLHAILNKYIVLLLQIVGSMLSKVMEEFERRVASQNEMVCFTLYNAVNS